MLATPYLSKYGASLRGFEKERYMAKISKFPKDPYLIDYDDTILPKNVSYLELYEYLVHTKSFYTQQEFKSYKSLEAHKLFKSGWVQHIAGFKMSTGYLVFGKVLHSQSLNLAPLKVWIEICLNGSVVSAHCTCVAGLAESCSHIGAILFTLNAVGQNDGNTDVIRSVTDVKAYWLIPSCKSMLQLCNENINYNLRDINTCRNVHISSSKLSQPCIKNEIFEKLLSKGKVPVGTLGLDEFLSEEKDVEIEHFLGIYMSGLYKVIWEKKALNDLLYQFNTNNFVINAQQADIVEQNTRSQSNSEYWFKLRLGRITASIFKEVYSSRTAKAAPINLIRRICYPSIKDNIQTKAMIYGKKTEKIALKVLLHENKEKHKKLKLDDCGLFILKTKSFYAASPDSIWSCKCCGTCPVEIKCPFNFREEDIQTYMQKKDCPIRLVNNNYEMVTNHKYYFQVQLQGFIAASHYAYFYIYLKTKSILIKVPIDQNFVLTAMLKTDLFFKTFIFPELLGKFYTSSAI